MTPRLFVLSGPSGVGKTTIVRAVLERIGNLEFSVSCTTRPPRAGEREGVDYYFISPQQFAALVRAGQFLEHAWVYGHRYGTPLAEVEQRLQRGKSVLLDIDTQGAAAVHRRRARLGFPTSFIFVLPPSREELLRRLEGRKSETVEELRRRLEEAWEQTAAGMWFDYLVINRHLEEAISWVTRLIRLELLG
ncbi:MAG: guanylate kinase [Candidatus Acetothermia bacterium]|jgi:guanylate kinase|nr:guanylate kinase [Candidatus Acetothermia bacterium]MDH7505030.1 guanylate kinase [Candidatus Acetothermia bacterium]